MSKIIFTEGIETVLVCFLVGALGSCSLHKLYNAVTDKAPYLVDASFGKGEGAKGVIDGGVKVTESIKERAVKVENYCFIYSYQSFAFVMVI